jgi:tetratricopeptide (TPR) repeat protein
MAIRAETEMHIAQLSFYRFDIVSTLTYGKRALQLARKEGLQEIAARSLYALSLATLLQGDWEAVISYAREARDLYQVLHNPSMEAQCLKQIAKTHISTGQLQEGLAAARESYKIDLEVGDPSMIVYSAYHLVTALLETGAYSEALSLAQQTMTTARTCNNAIMLALSLTTLGRVYRALLDLPSAYRAHNEALTCYRDLPQEPLIEQIDADLCVDCVLAHNWGEAHTYAMQALNRHNEHSYAYQTFTRWYETAALLQAGDLQRATQDVQRFEERTHNNPRYRIPYLRAQAELDRHQQHVKQALEHLHEATALAQQIGLPGELWSLEIERAELFAQSGDQLEANRSRAHAVEIAHTLVDDITDERTRSRFLENVQAQHVVS